MAALGRRSGGDQPDHLQLTGDIEIAAIPPCDSGDRSDGLAITAPEFEKIYASVGDDLAQIPWAHLQPHPAFRAWLEEERDELRGESRRALVVGCGLGDDAAELARRGYEVTAFDASPTAIAWCRNRFPHSTATFLVTDLLDLPAAWADAFDLVVEINTIQSIPLAHRNAAIAAIASTVAPGGVLFVRCFLRDDDEPVTDAPWPISRRELSRFATAGLRERSFAIVERNADGARLVRNIWERPRR